MTRLDVITEPNGHGTPPPAAPQAQDAPPGSVLAQLRARAQRQRADHTLDVPIDIDPWNGILVARYRMPPLEDADRLIAAAATLTSTSGPTPSMTRTSVDLLATCCVTLLGRAETGELEDLEHRYTGRLLTLLALPLPQGVDDAQDATVGEVLGVLFSDNWLAVNAHAAKVMGWLQGGESALGEASAAT